MKNAICLIILFFIVIGLNGCATKTIGPNALGKNKYIIARQEGAFPSGDEQLLSEAITEAHNFCRSLDKDVEVIKTHENQGPFIFGNYPKGTVTFKCIAK
jgi:hypothetical protein